MPIAGAVIMPHSPALVAAAECGQPRELHKTVDACRAAARRVRAWEPEVLIVVSPHAAMYADYFHIASGRGASGDLSAFGAPQISLETAYDPALCSAITRWARAANIQTGSLGGNSPVLDYGTLVPLYFLREAGVQAPIVRIGLSELSALKHYQFGTGIAKGVEVEGRRAVFVASANLSHRRKDDTGSAAFDEQVTAAMASGDFLQLLTMDHALCAQARPCGASALQIMAGVLDGLAVAPELLGYECATGVGHGVAAFTVTGPDESRRFAARCEAADRARLERRRAAEDPWVQLARLSLETYVRTKRELATLPEDLPAELTQRAAGVFVTLSIQGRLRGCVGTIHPTTDSVAWEIVRNAVAAGSRDRRFSRVWEYELDSLEYTVKVLGEPEPIDSPAELDVKKYGVVVSHGLRWGVMLPNANGVDTVELQIALARDNAGIDAQEPYTLQRFTVVQHT